MVALQLERIVSGLSDIEKKTLRALVDDKPLSFEDISRSAGINIDSVRRAAAWLDEKGIAEVVKTKLVFVIPTNKAKDILPERKFLQTLKDLGGTAPSSKIKNKSALNPQEFNVAFGLAKKNRWIEVFRELEVGARITANGKRFLDSESPEERRIRQIKAAGKAEKTRADAVLIKRGLVEEKTAVERKLKTGTNTKKALQLLKEVRGARSYNIRAPVPKIFIGKKQPYIQFLEQIRRKLIELGFKEMYSPLIVPEFYNFDVLFQPQNHPARTWSDTYQLKQPTHGKLPHPKVVKSVKAAHETGGVSASSGWGYGWSEIVASKLMPSAHATAHSARQIVHGIEIPGKYFAIARCYRPDIVDASHLIEFNQMDGFIVGEDLTFKNLLGILKQFAVEVAGATKVRFYPDYYPFTEPSVQLSAKHPEMGWIEFAGAGIFRPEMMENLGVKEPTIAWGMGIDRLAMFKLGIKDIRYLFSDDLNWLRNAKMVE